MKTFFFHVSNTVNPARIAFEKFTACTVQVIHRSVIDYCRLHRQASSSDTSTNKPYHFELADLIPGVFRSHRYVVATLHP